MYDDTDQLANVYAKQGVDEELDELATEILQEDRRRRGVTKHSEMKDWLSPGQIYRRQSREILPTSGVPDKSYVSGLFHRVYNPNTRPHIGDPDY